MERHPHREQAGRHRGHRPRNQRHVVEPVGRAAVEPGDVDGECVIAERDCGVVVGDLHGHRTLGAGRGERGAPRQCGPGADERPLGVCGGESGEFDVVEHRFLGVVAQGLVDFCDPPDQCVHVGEVVQDRLALGRGPHAE
ncbi:hypothetical protein [Kibdelosporangium philippinense]|uniref:hypothetical protein n=1 Tax=Kibdelosporangium philippinense TaxID=211113 RepID=UPI00360DD058